MISRIQGMIPENIQPWLATAYRHVRRRLLQLDRTVDRRTLDEASFIGLLKEVGFSNGAVVLVHSSMDKVARRVPGLSATRAIQIFRELVGADGTIMMPSFPFLGKQLHYVQSSPRFDVRRTPSQVGLITEVFRRMPGVIRSLHPTHAFAAWGRHAQELLSEHHCGDTFGIKSPIFRLQHHNGLVAGIGTGLRDSFTILHVTEECHPQARAHFFEPDPGALTVVDGDGSERICHFPVLRDHVRRDYERVERVMLKKGVLRYLNRRGLRCAVANAGSFIAASMELADQNRYL